MLARLSLYSLLVAALIPAATAHAGFTVTVNHVGDVSYTDSAASAPRYVNATQCEDNVNVVLAFQGVPSATVLDFWKGTSCVTAASRTGDNPTCTHLAQTVSVEIGGNSEITLSVPVRDLLSGDTVQAKCVSSTVHVFALAAEQAKTTEEITQDKSVEFELEVDVNAPAAPSDVRGGAGDTAVPVHWEAAGDSSVEQYEVYAVPVETCDENTAGSNDVGLEANGVVDGTSDRASTATKGASSQTVDPSSIGLDYEEGTNTAEVAVAAVDLAGNRSMLSNVACIERVPTSGFCDRHEALGGECKNWNCAVNRPGADRHARWPAASLLVALGWLGWARARRQP